MESICKRCKYSKSCKAATTKGNEQLKVMKCSRFDEQKPFTNADRVRSMTDEELENWFWWLQKEMMYYTDSVVFVHEWLKQEVDE